jgi:hypothetical protein
MKMSWETQSNPFLTIGILHQTSHVYPEMLLAAMRLERPGWRTSVIFQSDAPIDISRSIIATQALKNGSTWLFFWDSDIIIPSYALTRLVSHNLPIVSGLYYRRHPQVFPEAFKYDEHGIYRPLTVEEIQMLTSTGNPLIEVDGCGAGCLLIHRTVLERLKDKVPLRRVAHRGPPPAKFEYYEFFSWQMGRVEAGPSYSEDLAFCDLARKEGFKIYVDTKVSCGHLTKMAIKDGAVRWSPLETGTE